MEIQFSFCITNNNILEVFLGNALLRLILLCISWKSTFSAVLVLYTSTLILTMSVNIDDFEGRLFIGSNLFKYDLIALFIDLFVCYTPSHNLIVDFLKIYRTTRSPWHWGRAEDLSKVSVVQILPSGDGQSANESMGVDLNSEHWIWICTTL